MSETGHTNATIDGVDYGIIPKCMNIITFLREQGVEVKDSDDNDSVAAAIKKWYSAAKKLNNSEEWVYNLNRRPIVTEKQIFSFIGATGNMSRTNYTGSCFRPRAVTAAANLALAAAEVAKEL